MRLMLDYFSENFTEEQLQANMQRYNLENTLAIVKDYFLKEYGYVANNIELNNRYQRTINSYIYNDEKNPAVVHTDELFDSTMMAFFWLCSNGRRTLTIWECMEIVICMYCF